MYYNLLSQLKNASLVKKKDIRIPFSSMDLQIAKLLVDAGFLSSVDKKTINKKSYLDIALTYDGERPRITNFKLVSKPSRHIYVKGGDLRPVLQNYGIGVISTSGGMMTNKEAKKKGVGGEYLFKIW